MTINKRLPLLVAGMCLFCVLPLLAVTYTVSKDGRGMFTTIQEAVNKAAPGDIVQILDVVSYPEQVTIDSTKNGLTLTSVAPTALNKPKIVWQDKVNVGPRTYAESRIDSMITFDRNGALRILGGKNVTINGIAVDGGGPYVYGYPNIWNQQSDLVFGNAALTIWVAGDARIVNCDISNAYLGINFKDRNQGGIFANANPADLQPQNIVPMSGFGKTGNHLVEYCRVHNNSVGIYFESSWDLGSTIRYNLIYENHHQSKAFAQQVFALPAGGASEGHNNPGGAMMFKDAAYSPVSIYNNTYWHNFLIFIGHWRTGLQHLIFNNIYAKPYAYWNGEPVFGGQSYMELTTYLPNRMNNCVYTCQLQAPATGYVAIMNQLQVPQGAGGAGPTPGTLLSAAAANTAFPASANIRWLEMDSTMFNSMDPATVNFLEPKWTDTLVSTYIKNQGWQKSGVKNMDGGWADLGAIASDGSRPTDLASIRPNDPVTINNNTATLKFTISERVGKLQSPTMKLFRWVGNLPFINQASGDWSGRTIYEILANNITDITLPAAPALRIGVNTFTATIPAQTTDYAFFEGIIEGKDANGKAYTTSTGFLPYRKLDYKFVVEVWKGDLSRKLDTVTVGDTVVLKIIPQKKDGSSFTNTINPVDVSLASPYTLWNTSLNPMAKLTYPTGITGATNRTVMFTKVPDGGIEVISATGVWKASTADTSKLVFQGSANVVLLAGPPAKVIFQDPLSTTFKLSPPTLNPGQPYSGYLYVYDKWDNKVSKPASVTLTSLTPTLATFVSATTTTDATGTGKFQVNATNTAQENDLIKLQALLNATNYADTAFMKVGKRAERLFIFYGDTMLYNPATRLEGQVGDRLLVTVIATKSDNPTKDSIVATRTDTFTVSGTPGSLVFYNSATAAAPAANFVLVNGRASVWVSSSAVVSNGQMTLAAYSISSGNPRDQIYFTKPAVSIDSAFYYSSGGWGMVDRVEIFSKNKLTLIDSITLFWPGADSGKRVVAGGSAEMKLAPDSMHITIVLNTPFAREITASTALATTKQGIMYTRVNTNVPEDVSAFAIKDRVGPLIMTAQVLERIPPGPGTDTMFVSFSESVQPATLTGNGLSLIKNGTATMLVIQAATPIAGNLYKLVVTGASFPQVGDSLRIQPGGPITDALGNIAHPSNRPVVITLRSIPASILGGNYVDRDALQRADGIVDTVFVAFNKKVTLSDLLVSLDWGGTIRADSLNASSMQFVSGDSLVAIGVLGKFKNLPSDNIKTSGVMTATVNYISIPGESAKGPIADKAAPVAVDSAVYYPSSGTGNGFLDTLYVTFSEKLDSIGGLRFPFNLLRAPSTNYQIRVDKNSYNAATLVTAAAAGSRYTYKFYVDSITAVQFPITGDSLWLGRGADNNGSGVTDDAGNMQTNYDNNRKVPLRVFRIPFKPIIKQIIAKNPFSPPDSFRLQFLATIPRMVVFGNVTLSASGKVYDVLGNCVHAWPEKTIQLNATHGNNQGLTIGWDGRNLSGRYVGSGVYQAVFSFNQDDGKNKTGFADQRIKIGVKR